MPLTRELAHHQVLNPTLLYRTYDSPTSEEPLWNSGLDVHASPRGYLEKRPGLIGVESSQTSFTSIQRVFTWRRWAGSFFIMLNDVTATQSKVYKLEVGVDPSFILIYTSSSASPFDFVVANNFVFFGNSSDMKKWDSVTVTNWGISSRTLATATAGPNSPTAESDKGSSWSNVANVQVADGVYATASIPNGSTYTSSLYVTGFGFGLPSDALILGITVEMKIKSDNAPSLPQRLACTLLRGGIATGLVRDKTNFIGVFSDASYTSLGGTSDLWGTSWTYSDINGSGFGVGFFCQHTPAHGTTTFSDDHVRITVTYSTTGTPTVATSATGITAVTGYKYVYCYENAGTEHLSSPTGESASTGAFANKQVDVGTTASTDVQVTGIRIFRTTDGGGVAYFGITGNPFANSTGNKTDTTADTALSSQVAPTAGFNDPPPASAGFAYWANRIWMFTGNKVWFTGWEEINNGVPEECVPSGTAGNFWAFDSEITGVATVGDGVLVFTPSSIWKIVGDSLDTFRRSEWVLRGMGCRNRAAIASFAKVIAWLDVGNSVWVTDGDSVTEIGTDILPDLDGIDHSQASMTFFNSKTFQWLCLLDGGAGRLRIFDARRQKWQTPWTVGGRSIWAGETVSGTTELIVGHSTGKCLKLSATAFTDNGTAYGGTLGSNLFAICRDGRPDTLGALQHLGFESNVVEPSKVEILTDDDPTTGAYTNITANVRNAELRAQGANLLDRWYPVAGQQSKAARRLAFKLTWPTNADQWKLYSYDIAYQVVGGRS
jgi:hypothetical protein